MDHAAGVEQELSVFEGVRGVIFDCDGTLADSMPIHRRAWHEAMARYGFRSTDDFLDSQNGAPTKDIIVTVNRLFGADIPVEDFCTLKERLAAEQLSEVKPIPQVVQIARSLKGRLPVALASGGTIGNVRIILRAIGLDNFFDAMVTASDPVRPKPYPDIFVEAANRLGVSPEHCQVFEDGAMGIQAAEAAGMRVLDIRPFIRR